MLLGETQVLLLSFLSLSFPSLSLLPSLLVLMIIFSLLQLHLHLNPDAKEGKSTLQTLQRNDLNLILVSIKLMSHLLDIIIPVLCILLFYCVGEEKRFSYFCVYTVSSGDPPSMPELLRLQVPEKVGAKYYKFGILLLNDESGSRLETIESDCRGDSERIVLRILRDWKAGQGLPVTWESLIQTLRDMKLFTLADQIEASH